MYGLSSHRPLGLDPVFCMFEQPNTEECTVLFKLIEDAASNKMVNMRIVIDLKEQVLEESFEVLFSNSYAGHIMAELLATYRDNILRKGKGERLSDRAIEQIMEELVGLVFYVL